MSHYRWCPSLFSVVIAVVIAVVIRSATTPSFIGASTFKLRHITIILHSSSFCDVVKSQYDNSNHIRFLQDNLQSHKRYKCDYIPILKARQHFHIQDIPIGTQIVRFMNFVPAIRSFVTEV